MLGERSSRSAANEQQLNDRLQAAETGLQEARRASEAAEQATQAHGAALEKLNREVASGETDRATLEHAVEEARRDADTIKQNRSALDRQLAALDQELTKSPPEGDPSAQAELARMRDQLLAERDQLDQQLQALAGAIDAADGLG